MTARSRNGEARATTDDATMIGTTATSEPRCGANRRPMRRSETSRACAFSAAVTALRPARRDVFSVSVSKWILPVTLLR